MVDSGSFALLNSLKAADTVFNFSTDSYPRHSGLWT